MYKLSAHSGMQLDVIAFGTYNINPGEETYVAVTKALEAGYKSIDTARFYKNEEDVGRAVRNFGANNIHITTKVWNDMQGYENALKSARTSRDLLGGRAIDLLLVHWPTRNTNRMLDTWKAFEQLKSEGTVKHIGVSNFNEAHLEEIETAGLSRPESNQIEINPAFTQNDLRVYCENKGIIVEAWRPLLNGHLDLLKTVESIAKKYNKTTAQIALRWGISSGMRVLAKSINEDRIKENINIFDFDLNSEEMKKIDSLNKDFRQGPDPAVFE